MICRNRALAAAAVLTLAFAAPALAQETSGEEAAIRAALQHYLLGHATGDGTHHARVFDP